MFSLLRRRRAGSSAAALSFSLSSVSSSTVLLALAGGAAAQATDTLVVSATRVPTAVSQLVADVTVIDRAALDRAQGRTLVELLSREAGLQFTANGGLGKVSGLFIRGLEARHTLLLVDGVRVGSATLGTPSLDNLPLEAIERIEIVRGPMSAVYGSGAMGGVIQVFTRRGGSGFTANAKLTAGSNRFAQAGGGVGIGDGGVFDAAVQAQHTDVRGSSATNPRVPFGQFNPDRDGFRQNGGSLRLGWQPLADWRFELVSLHSDATSAYDDGLGADALSAIENRFVALSARGRVVGDWGTRIAASSAIDQNETLTSASAFASLGAVRTTTRQFAWENTLPTPVGTVLALLERIEERVARPGVPYAVGDRTIDAAGLGLSGSAGAHAWQASARRDRNSQFGGQSTGAIAWGWAFAPAWRFGASAGTSYVAPSFNQLYFPRFGNPDLVPEEGRHGELSVAFNAGETRLRAAAFRNRYRGFITGGTNPTNLPRAEIDGVTLAAEGRAFGVDWTASIDRVDPRNATVGSANLDKRLPRRAREALRAGADWQRGALGLGASLAAFSHRFDDAANTARLPGYATLDLRASWALTRELELALKLNNAFDRRYETALGYEQPGREGFVTLKAAWR